MFLALNRRPAPGLRRSLMLAALWLLLAACGDNTAIPPATTTPTGLALTNTVPAIQATPTSSAATPAATLTPATRAAITDTGIATLPAGVTAPATLVSPTAGQTGLATTPAIITRASGEKLSMTFELARTAQEQSTGLMGRSRLPEDTGMLFIFQQPGLGGFWMKNTPLPLSIAFIDVKGQIVDIQDMQPFSEEVHAPTREYLWALEVPQGYFARKGVKPGDTVTLAGSR